MTDVVIVGGGAVGLSLAYELACRGRKVTLLDKGDVGRESSWAGAGIVPPAGAVSARSPLAPLAAASAALHVEWHRKLLQETGIDNGYRLCGATYLADTPELKAELEAEADLWRAQGVDHRLLDATELRHVEPALDDPHAAGRTPAEHLAHLGRLWSGFSQVAAANPHAWIRTAMTPEEVVTPTAGNRLIGYPYTLVMNSNNNVEQAAAVLLCSAEKAEALGVPPDRWVFPVAGSEANDRAHVSPRNDLCSSPALRRAGAALFDAVGIGADDVGPVDLYSCFPSAVQIAAAELGLGVDRPLTVTGGMGFAGGPWNNYATHGIATMVEVLRRETPGTLGLCSANGGFTTKHALGLYATEPPVGGFRHTTTQAEADALAAPGRGVAPDDHAGPVTVEAYTVMHGRDGDREVALAATLLPDGRRAWCSTRDADIMAALIDEECCGRPAQRAASGSLRLG